MNKKLKRKAFIYSAEGSHDPSQIILIFLFAAQETFLIIINVEKKGYGMLLNICRNHDIQPFKCLVCVCVC